MPPTADLIAALKRRWRLELALFVVVLVLVAIWTALTPRVYVATSSLLFDESPVDPVADTVRSDDVAGLLATQADVIKSESIAADVSRSLNLATPAMVQAWRDSTGGTGDVNAWRGRQLLGDVIVTPERSSRVLSINFKSPDPSYAAVVANGFASAYLEARLKQKTDPARTYSRWFADRTREVRTQLEQAQSRLTDFQRKTGIVDTAANTNADMNRLNELSNQLSSAEGIAADTNSRARSSAAQSIDVQSSGVVQGLRSQIAAKAAQVSQLASAYGPNHPDRIAAEAELRELRQKLGAEVGTTTRSVQVASSAANAREADLRGRLDNQRRRMLLMAGDRAQLDVLQRDVDSSRAAYDAVTEKLGTMRLQSEAPTNNAHQLDFAAPPSFPALPNVPLRIVLGAVLGGLLALALGVALELFRPRVRTVKGLAQAAGRPVIARIELDSSRVASLLNERAAL